MEGCAASGNQCLKSLAQIMKRVIVNADDFGLSKGINEGIIKAHREGILTSATLMVNMPGFANAIEEAAKYPSLGVGIHLNVIRGKPVLPPEDIPSLVNKKGFFWGNVFLVIQRVWARKIKINEIIWEFRAQIEKAQQAGLALTHADSEKHFHCFYPVLQKLLPMLKDCGLPRIRYINQICSLKSPKMFVLSWVVNWAWRRCRSQAQQLKFRLTDNFFGLCTTGRMSRSNLIAILKNLPPGTSEIMVHPGYITPEEMAVTKETGDYRLWQEREMELEALLDPELPKILKSNKIELINFGQV